MGRMLDFAVYELKFKLDGFYDMFLVSGIADRFGKGDFSLLTGMSGVEIAYEVLDRSNISYERIKPRYPVDRSPEYWTGWALAYYQWFRNFSFAEINRAVPIKSILSLYNPYHEMDIRQFCDKMDEMYKKASPETALKRYRLVAGLSQSALAKEADISVRTIQQYEQRQKNINKAQAETLVKLSKVLCCDVEDLMEKVS